eukprot:Gregarina_sp_Pseudo_9__3469@NODE_3636_length_595_cov_180_055755_g3325_i0_p2_GENE_NODE_3636_length_595_cov_180_055755_g3325_i0NODE_3636_length_595_cov_180_055755_g3325_i0_p2_ORF_typecomplete_len134_score21_02Ribosomal_S24e/PF01282_19/4_6e03Ribosomal_S24e/PF01282_19/1_2e27_NODE_3636_length_595_cov_180_055755_g3325_i0112513
MSSDYTLRVKKFQTNPLLQRKQFHVEVVHPSSGTIPKLSIREQLAKAYKISDLNRIVVHGFTTAFGGGRSNGFGCIYDSSASAKKFERNYRLARLGIADVKTAAVNRRAKKDIRTRRRKVRGTAKAKVSGGKK